MIKMRMQEDKIDLWQLVKTRARARSIVSADRQSRRNSVRGTQDREIFTPEIDGTVVRPSQATTVLHSAARQKPEQSAGFQRPFAKDGRAAAPANCGDFPDASHLLLLLLLLSLNRSE